MSRKERVGFLCRLKAHSFHQLTFYDFRNLGRPIDIFADNSIIEGKLEPNNVDIDRLIGQISDFLTYNCHIYIVCYGATEQRILNRIKTQVVDLHPNRINLVYLLNPQRSRREIPFEDRTLESNKLIQDYGD